MLRYLILVASYTQVNAKFALVYRLVSALEGLTLNVSVKKHDTTVPCFKCSVLRNQFLDVTLSDCVCDSTAISLINVSFIGDTLLVYFDYVCGFTAFQSDFIEHFYFHALIHALMTEKTSGGYK